ncbi:MAG: hypothetical protein AAGA23_20275 [Pseudomonadota bacterium]
MNRITMALGLAGLCLTAQAHDGGVSTLKVCRGATATTVTWDMHDAQGSDRSWLRLSQNGEQEEPAAFEKTGQHDVKLRWEFSGLQPDRALELEAHGLAELAHGHRVLASNCDSSRRAVLSEWQVRWLL